MTPPPAHSVTILGGMGRDVLVDTDGREWSAIGGSAWFAAFGAATVCPVRLVAAIGRDFPAEAIDQLERAGVDTSGIHRDDSQDSFFWKARYGAHPDERETIVLLPNVEDDFLPDLSSCNDRFVYLANCQPRLQASALAQLPATTFVALDTIDRWISDRRDELCAMLPRVDLFLINADEARLLTASDSPEQCCRKILELGPRHCILKMGSRGSMVADSHGSVLHVPAHRIETVLEATGAGDTFGGAVIGTLAASSNPVTIESLAAAANCASAVAAHRIGHPGIDHLIGWTPPGLLTRH